MMARRRFFVTAIERGHARITGEEAHHLSRVLRVEAGQKFEISDNKKAYLAEVESARKDLVSFTVLEQIEAPEAIVHTALFAALIKFERFEWLIEKATELGVAAVTPVETDRSENGLERAAPKRLERWRRIAREASEQSRRVRLPAIEPPIVLRRTEAGTVKQSPRQATWWSGRTRSRAAPSRDRHGPSGSVTCRSGTPVALALSISAVVSALRSVTSRVKSGPSRSRSEPPSSIGKWGSRWPGRAVGMYSLTAWVGGGVPSGMTILEWS